MFSVRTPTQVVDSQGNVSHQVPRTDQELNEVVEISTTGGNVVGNVKNDHAVEIMKYENIEQHQAQAETTQLFVVKKTVQAQLPHWHEQSEILIQRCSGIRNLIEFSVKANSCLTYFKAFTTSARKSPSTHRAFKQIVP